MNSPINASALLDILQESEVDAALVATKKAHATFVISKRIQSFSGSVNDESCYSLAVTYVDAVLDAVSVKLGVTVHDFVRVAKPEDIVELVWRFTEPSLERGKAEAQAKAFRDEQARSLAGGMNH